MSTNSSFRASEWYQVTPSDTASLPKGVPGGIRVTVAGSLSMADVNGTVMTVDVEVGDLPYRPTRVMAATTATVWALY